MIYTMNGMTTQLNLMSDRPGVFRGLSSHFNGDGFSSMHFTLSAVQPAEFATWVAQARQGGGPVLDAASYKLLSRQSLDVPPFTYRAAEPGLFANIVRQALPPGPGPALTPESVVSPRTERAAMAPDSALWGKLSWAAIPFDSPLPAVRFGHRGNCHRCAVLAWIIVKGYFPLCVA